MSPRLPSRYEDLDQAFRGRLRPNQALLEIVKSAFSAMEISGGIRFLPVFGDSGSGKTSAALEIGTHLPDLQVVELTRDVVEAPEKLPGAVSRLHKEARGKYLVIVIDQYEEAAEQRTAIPTNFVEALSLLDRGSLRNARVLFIWLTTSRAFQSALVRSTSRNRRILAHPNLEIHGPLHDEWPSIIEETFQFHNQEKTLSDYEIIDHDLEAISVHEKTIGDAIEKTGSLLQKYSSSLHDLSTYMVVMLWPVTDGLRITRIQQFSDPRRGYKLDWNAWFRQLNRDDHSQLPLKEYNRTRLYFDMRLVPIAAADLHPLCKELDNDKYKLGRSYLKRLEGTHFYSIVKGMWNPDNYAPLRERDSKRADQAREWYASVNTEPTKLGKRIARCLKELDVGAEYERTVTSPHGRVRADILIDRTPINPPNLLVEMKAFSPENTMPSTICQQILITLRRHAQFAGFLPRQ